MNVSGENAICNLYVIQRNVIFIVSEEVFLTHFLITESEYLKNRPHDYRVIFTTDLTKSYLLR